MEYKQPHIPNLPKIYVDVISAFIFSADEVIKNQQHSLLFNEEDTAYLTGVYDTANSWYTRYENFHNNTKIPIPTPVPTTVPVDEPHVDVNVAGSENHINTIVQPTLSQPTSRKQVRWETASKSILHRCSY